MTKMSNLIWRVFLPLSSPTLGWISENYSGTLLESSTSDICILLVLGITFFHRHHHLDRIMGRGEEKVLSLSPLPSPLQHILGRSLHFCVCRWHTLIETKINKSAEKHTPTVHSRACKHVHKRSFMPSHKAGINYRNTCCLWSQFCSMDGYLIFEGLFAINRFLGALAGDFVINLFFDHSGILMSQRPLSCIRN